MPQRVAVFVDGENLGSSHAAGILRIAAVRGDVLLARVYGNLGKLNGWSDVARYAVVHAGTGKNATDVLLSLDALELAMQGRFDICMVASSDRDFSYLVVKLRESGVRVVGTGEHSAPVGGVGSGRGGHRRCSGRVWLLTPTQDREDHR